MKLVTNLLAVICLTMSSVAWAQKADGYAWEPNDNFHPGIYEATVDAKVYTDIDKKAIAKGVIVKKGTRISVYSAGYHHAQPPSIDWFNLSEGQECNGKVLPWSEFGWIGVLKKDFTRVGDLPKPMYKYGLITNCATTHRSSPVAAAGSPFLVIKAVPETTPDKGVKSRSRVVVTGKIEFGHNVAGGNFQINGGKKKQYILVYVGFIDEATQAELGKLADSGTTVTVKGTLEVWKDGSAGFDNAHPISIFK